MQDSSALWDSGPDIFGFRRKFKGFGVFWHSDFMRHFRFLLFKRYFESPQNFTHISCLLVHETCQWLILDSFSLYTDTVCTFDTADLRSASHLWSIERSFNLTKIYNTMNYCVHLTLSKAKLCDRNQQREILLKRCETSSSQILSSAMIAETLFPSQEVVALNQRLAKEIASGNWAITLGRRTHKYFSAGRALII